MRSPSYKYVCKNCEFETYREFDALDHIGQKDFSHTIKRKVIDKEEEDD
jgi:hypothetical protein